MNFVGARAEGAEDKRRWKRVIGCSPEVGVKQHWDVFEI